MNILRNEKLIKRNARIGQIAMFGGLLVLAGGMFISFRYPELFNLSLIALLVGFILSQVGIYFSNRWGRRPRPDELIDQALKGLDNKYSLYHYTAPVSHLLVGASGVWALFVYPQRGTIYFSNGRYRQRGGNFYLKLFAQEGLGRPEIEVSGAIRTMEDFFKKHLPEDKIPPVKAVMVFSNPKVSIEIPEDASIPADAVTPKGLKNAIRKSGKNKSLSPEWVKLIQEAIENQ